MKKRRTYTSILAISACQNLTERMKGEDKDFETHCTKTKTLIETLTEEILTAASRETEFVYRDKSYQGSIFDKFNPLKFRCKNSNALLSN